MSIANGTLKVVARVYQLESWFRGINASSGWAKCVGQERIVFIYRERAEYRTFKNMTNINGAVVLSTNSKLISLAVARNCAKPKSTGCL